MRQARLHFLGPPLLNASQVTNPSIDPLREPMEIRTYLGAKPDKLELATENGETVLKTQLTRSFALTFQ